ncbi:hypothetical protein [Streptomyces bullii]|uniref:Secreted protein n=1 Tax=Streptomyces bullii TaxID=349910 RepID=A0ABW0UXG3_9ACTN
MSQTWKIVSVVAAGVGIASTPVVWLLDSPDTGQLAGASVQAATGIVALLWALLQRPAATPASPEPGPGDEARNTGAATATAGGDATSGVVKPADAASGPARADSTGPAHADGAGSSANTGVRYTR